MQIVERAMQYPAQCFWTFKTDADGGGPWLDLGRDFDERHDGRMYLSVTAAMTFGEAAGMVRPETHEAALEQVAQKDAAIAELEEKVRQLEEFKQAVYVMKSEGYQSAKKPGRPVNKKEPANA